MIRAASSVARSFGRIAPKLFCRGIGDLDQYTIYDVSPFTKRSDSCRKRKAHISKSLMKRDFSSMETITKEVLLPLTILPFSGM